MTIKCSTDAETVVAPAPEVSQRWRPAPGVGRRAGRGLQMLVAEPDRLLWAVRVRWLVVGGFLLLALAAHAVGLLGSVAPCVRAAIVGVVVNAANHWCVRRRRLMAPVTAIAIPGDHLLITYVVVHTGGVQSPFVMMYVVQVLATALLVDTRIAAGSALLAMLAFLAGVNVRSAGYVAAPTLLVAAAPTPSASLYHAMWAAFLLYCLALLVYLGGYISDRLRASEHELRENNQRLQAALTSLSTAHEALNGAYRRLQQTEAHLIQSEKMRGLGYLVAGVAHELSNPISFVSANVEHLRTYLNAFAQTLEAYAALPLAEPERQRVAATRRALRIDEALADLPALLDDCEEGARRTKQIVTELRTFSRSGERDTWERVDLHRGLDSTLALLAHRVGKHVTLHRNFGVLPDVECLSGQLNQVFMNLLVNALDAIGAQPGGIWITTRVLAADATASSTPWVQITIRDDGPGMSPDVQSRIFDPFFTTKDVGQGTGLGLSVSYGIVERHGGRLAVESSPGTGAAFTVLLPARQSKPTNR